MTNLTEYSWYYCKMKNGDIEMHEYVAGYFLSGDVPLLNNEVESVLGEVPSYEEWQAKLEENTKLKERNDSLNNRDINLCRIANGIRDENFVLKELLKRIGKELSDCPTCVEGSLKAKLVDDINQVLGE